MHEGNTPQDPNFQAPHEGEYAYTADQLAQLESSTSVVPELQAVGTPDTLLSGPRETGAFTRPDGVTIDSRVVGGMKETRLHGMGSQHDLPKTAAELFAEGRESQDMTAAVEAAAVRETPIQQSEALRQMDIAAADRKNREAAGLPPRTHDLR